MIDILARILINAGLPVACVLLAWPLTMLQVIALIVSFVVMAVVFSYHDGRNAP